MREQTLNLDGALCRGRVSFGLPIRKAKALDIQLGILQAAGTASFKYIN